MEKIDLWPGRNTGVFRPYLEVRLLPGNEIRGAVVVCPGGGYYKRSDHEGAPVAETFAAMGFHTFVLQYRVHPTRFPEPQQDALRAIRIVRAHAAEWNVAPDKIVHDFYLSSPPKNGSIDASSQNKKTGFFRFVN